MTVRIGTDVKLNATLTRQQDKQPVNIVWAGVYFVNRTKLEEIKAAQKSTTPYRFPKEPNSNAYSSTAYDIKSSGNPSYNVFPSNVYVSPKITRRLVICEGRTRIDENRSVVHLLMPANKQYFIGTYNVLLTVKILDSECPGGMRTVTMDYQNAFNIVNNVADGVTEDVTMDLEGITPVEPIVPTLLDTYVEQGDYNNGIISLLRTDGQNVDIDIRKVTDWYEEGDVTY